MKKLLVVVLLALGVKVMATEMTNVGSLAVHRAWPIKDLVAGDRVVMSVVKSDGTTITLFDDTVPAGKTFVGQGGYQGTLNLAQ